MTCRRVLWICSARIIILLPWENTFLMNVHCFDNGWIKKQIETGAFCLIARNTIDARPGNLPSGYFRLESRSEPSEKEEK